MKGRFVYLTDSHWAPDMRDPPHSGVWQKELFDSHCQQLEDAAVDLIQKLSPDFVIHGGDLCRDPTDDDWKNAKRILAKFGCLCHIIPGNHDCWQQDQRRRMVEIFQIPENQLYYVREIGGLRFIFLDSSYLWMKDQMKVMEPTEAGYVGQNVKGIGVSPEQVEWFAQQLSGPCSEGPSVVVTHCPMVGKAGYPVKTRKEKPITVSLPEVDPQWMVDIHGCWVMPLEQRRADLLNIMRQHGDVRLVLAGHTHSASISVLDGVVHANCSSMSAWPLEMRLIEFDDSGLTIEPVQVDAPDLIEASYRREWDNDWAAGTSEYDRSARLRWAKQ